jgi:hypothetical protein
MEDLLEQTAGLEGFITVSASVEIVDLCFQDERWNTIQWWSDCG